MVRLICRVAPVLVLMMLAAPAARADDATDAKKAVEAFVTAWQSGDATTIKGTLAISKERVGDVGTVVDSIAAISKLQKAAATKFGASANDYFANASAQFDTRMKAVREGQITIKAAGASALLTIPPDETAKTKGGTIVIVKEGGAWKIDAKSLFNMSPETQKQTAELVAAARKLTPIAKQMTKEIEEGKYAAAVDAYQEFFTRYQAALKEPEAPAATSAPATMPATSTRPK